MLGHRLLSYSLVYDACRMAFLVLPLGACALLWFRPRVRVALLLVVGLHLTAWAAYVAPFTGSYGLAGTDRLLSLGGPACVAAGHSPWDHIQVGTPSVEPFWDVLVATLAGFDPARVISVYGVLSPFVLLLLAGAIALCGAPEKPLISDGSAGSEALWERVLVLAAVLGLTSLSLSNRSPLLTFWPANFLLKPNHAAGWAVLVCVAGLAAGKARSWRLGLMLGLLGWVFIIHWGFAVLALAVAELLRPAGERRWGRLLGAIGLSLALALPQVLNLMRAYGPFARSDVAGQVWRNERLGAVLADPFWSTSDLGLLLVLGVAGTLALLQRGGRRDRSTVGLILVAAFSSLVLIVAVRFGIAPEPDELHYFLRFALALGAGAALAAGARQLERWRHLSPGRGHVVALAACLAMSFPVYWNPAEMDPYFPHGIRPLEADLVALGGWIRQRTPRDAVFAAGVGTAKAIPAFTGRRVLLLGGTRPPADFELRAHVERTLFRRRNVRRVLAAARRYGVTHVVVDDQVRAAYRIEEPRARGAYTRVYQNATYTVYAVRRRAPAPLSGDRQPAPRPTSS